MLLTPFITFINLKFPTKITSFLMMFRSGLGRFPSWTCSRATQQASHPGRLCLAEFSQARASHHVSPVVIFEGCVCLIPFHLISYTHIYIEYIYIYIYLAYIYTRKSYLYIYILSSIYMYIACICVYIYISYYTYTSMYNM